MFLCGLGAKNDEQESKAARKMAQVKRQRGGGGRGWVMVRNLGSISADFRRLPGPVFHPLSSFVGMSAGSFSRTAAGNRT